MKAVFAGVRRLAWLLLLPLLLLAGVQQAAAAALSRHDVGEVTFLRLEGIIGRGDTERLKRLLPRGRRVVVVLNSAGGLLLEAIQMGSLLRLRGVSTAVFDGQVCMSACVIVWLGGVRRYLGQGAVMGAHAAYHDDGVRKRETGMGNALLGAYLNELGLSPKAIAYLTLAGPDDYVPITPRIAAELGIEVITLQNGMLRPVRSSRQAAREAFEQYFVLLSLLPDKTVTRRLAGKLQRKILFYGKEITAAEYMRRQLRYAQRWPYRMFVPKPETVEVKCGRIACVAIGVVEWLAANRKAGKVSVGLSVFSVGIGHDGKILYVNGDIVKVRRYKGLSSVEREVRQLKRKRYNFRFAR